MDTLTLNGMWTLRVHYLYLTLGTGSLVTFTEHILVPDILQGPKDKILSKNIHDLCHHGAYILVGALHITSITIQNEQLQ